MLTDTHGVSVPGQVTGCPRQAPTDPGHACAPFPVHTSCGRPSPRDHELWSWPLPFVVLAVEQPVEDLAQRAGMVQVVQDDDQRRVHGVVLAGALVGKVGQVLAQFLQRPGAERVGDAPQADAPPQSLTSPRPPWRKDPSYAVPLPATGGQFVSLGMEGGERTRKA